MLFALTLIWSTVKHNKSLSWRMLKDNHMYCGLIAQFYCVHYHIQLWFLKEWCHTTNSVIMFTVWKPHHSYWNTLSYFTKMKGSSCGDVWSIYLTMLYEVRNVLLCCLDFLHALLNSAPSEARVLIWPHLYLEQMT